MSIAQPVYQDGKWYRFEGYDALGKAVRVQVDPETVEIAAVQPEPAPENPLRTLMPGLPTVSKAKLQDAKKGLLYREPVHGHWYESIWLWFWVGVTVVGMFICWNLGLSDPATHEAMFSAPGNDPHGGGANMGFWIGWFGWVYYAWIPLGIGAVGALQKAGYQRLAVAWAVGLAALIAAFFVRNERAGNQAAARDANRTWSWQR